MFNDFDTLDGVNKQIYLFRMLKRINSPVPLYRRWKSTKSVRVGSIVIGDEILKGYVNDTNTHFLAKKCFRAGIKLGHSLEFSKLKNNIF